MKRTLFGAAPLLAAAGAVAQAFPSRAVTLVVPFPPGGGTDTGARIVAQKLSAQSATGSFILHVPYRGGGPAIGDLIAGHVQLSFMTVLEASGHIKAGKLRALAGSTTIASAASR